MMLVRVVAPHFVAGYEVSAYGTIWNAAPILKYVVGWEHFRALNYFDRKGWKYEFVA